MTFGEDPSAIIVPHTSLLPLLVYTSLVFSSKLFVLLQHSKSLNLLTYNVAK